MQKISDSKLLDTIQDNSIIGRPNMLNSTIIFEGEDNLLYFDEGVNIEDSTITFKGNNSLVIIRGSKYTLKVNIKLYNDSAFYLGRDASMNRVIECLASETRNIIIGDDCLFANSVYIRTGDAHRIYDISTRKRTNEGRSVFIGDHAWFAARVVVLKGSKIHSGSILGSDAVLPGKEVKSCCIFAGNPAKEVKSGVIYNKQGTHGMREEELEKISTISEKEIEKYIYMYSEEEYISFDEIENELKKCKLANQKFSYLNKRIFNNTKNRFSL